MSHETIFEIQASLCRAMGNPLRMEIMHVLRNGPLNGNDIAHATRRNQTTISRNLTILRNAGIVVVHREGNNILYRVANTKLQSVCDLMREALIEQYAHLLQAAGTASEQS
jgi:DNA-binding transcriptional ArsR family regulator